jgi:hypothetical protein
MSTPAPVSFTIRRPTPISRATSESSEPDTPNFKVPAIPPHLRQNSSVPGSPLARSESASPYPGDSSDEDEDGLVDELVTGFDKFGAQRCVISCTPYRSRRQLTKALRHDACHYSLHEKKQKPQGPLVIPALQNKDWRALARKRKGANQYVPDAGKQVTGADGSVGGLGTRDTINSGPQLSGLQTRKPSAINGDHDFAPLKEEEQEDVKMEEDPETEDQKALRALLADATGQSTADSLTIISTPVSEQDAYRQDVQELPESASLDDYDRVPVAQFGAALLRGMGWQEGTAASRKVGKDGKAKGITEPYMPEARPALLGIGAKERVIEDDGSNKKRKNLRPEKRYVPVIRKETSGENGRSPRDADISKSSRSDSRDVDRDRDRDRRRRSPRRDEPRTSSRRTSRSRSPRRDKYAEHDRDDGKESRRRYRDEGYEKDSGRNRDKGRTRDRSRERRS